MTIFSTSDPWPGASPALRRSLSQINFDSEGMRRLCAAAKAIGKYQSPGWTKDAWAHVTFPDKKVAVIIKTFTSYARASALREKWREMGWECAIVANVAIERASDARLVSDLKELLGIKK